jgi:hypothetical protein
MIRDFQASANNRLQHHEQACCCCCCYSSSSVITNLILDAAGAGATGTDNNSCASTITYHKEGKNKRKNLQSTHTLVKTPQNPGL